MKASKMHRQKRQEQIKEIKTKLENTRNYADRSMKSTQIALKPI